MRDGAVELQMETPQEEVCVCERRRGDTEI